MLTHDAVAGWNTARRRLDPARLSTWSTVTGREAEVSQSWGDGAALEALSSSSWDAVPVLDKQHASGWGEGNGEDVGAGSRWDWSRGKTCRSWRCGIAPFVPVIPACG